MKKKLLSAILLALLLSVMFVGTAFANPADAPGAGDPGDTANQAAGANPNAAVLGTPAEENSTADILQINIDHVPVCGGHASTH